MFRRPASEMKEVNDEVTNALPAKFCTLNKFTLSLLRVILQHELMKVYFLLGDVKSGFGNRFTDESSALCVIRDQS
jgi:hypothetical protein